MTPNEKLLQFCERYPAKGLVKQRDGLFKNSKYVLFHGEKNIKVYPAGASWNTVMSVPATISYAALEKVLIEVL